jgi:hypothetical protein
MRKGRGIVIKRNPNAGVRLKGNVHSSASLERFNYVDDMKCIQVKPSIGLNERDSFFTKGSCQLPEWTRCQQRQAVTLPSTTRSQKKTRLPLIIIKTSFEIPTCDVAKQRLPPTLLPRDRIDQNIREAQTFQSTRVQDQQAVKDCNSDMLPTIPSGGSCREKMPSRIRTLEFSKDVYSKSSFLSELVAVRSPQVLPPLLFETAPTKGTHAQTVKSHDGSADSLLVSFGQSRQQPSSSVPVDEQSERGQTKDDEEEDENEAYGDDDFENEFDHEHG